MALRSYLHVPAAGTAAVERNHSLFRELAESHERISTRGVGAMGIFHSSCADRMECRPGPETFPDFRILPP